MVWQLCDLSISKYDLGNSTIHVLYLRASTLFLALFQKKELVQMKTNHCSPSLANNLKNVFYQVEYLIIIFIKFNLQHKNLNYLNFYKFSNMVKIYMPCINTMYNIKRHYNSNLRYLKNVQKLKFAN